METEAKVVDGSTGWADPMPRNPGKVICNDLQTQTNRDHLFERDLHRPTARLKSGATGSRLTDPAAQVAQFA
jgi:hypothetical protein